MLRTLTALVAAVLLTLTTASVVQADKPDSLPDQASAKAALAAAKGLFRKGPEQARQRQEAGREATLVLRDLVRVRSRLTGADREAADAILARPTTRNPRWESKYKEGVPVETKCNEIICVHWVESTSDRIPRRDSDGNGIRDYAETALQTLTDVHNAYVAAGYRPPRSDGGKGGGPETDVYLINLGDEGLYGYCTSDERLAEDEYVAWPYCALDNNYSSREFPTNTPAENFQVTAAHEYFHAVQFAYDAFEDGWFMEATATWAEDELFDDVDDNVSYLATSPLSQPGRPLDHSGGMQVYGDWIFFRYLTERWTEEKAGLPTLVRDMWESADSLADDDYSLQAVRRVVGERGGAWTATFAEFATASRRPAQHYSEARANRYPRSRLSGSHTLGRHASTGWEQTRRHHLSSTTVRFTPWKGLTGQRWKLRLQLDLPPTRRGTAAVLTTQSKGLPLQQELVALDGQGDATVRLPFSSSTVSWVELTLVNASTRTRCWRDLSSPYSCLGRPLDDGQRFLSRGTTIR